MSERLRLSHGPVLSGTLASLHVRSQIEKDNFFSQRDSSLKTLWAKTSPSSQDLTGYIGTALKMFFFPFATVSELQ